MEITEKNRTGDFILSLANGTQSLENALLDEGEDLQAGAVLGQILGAAGVKASGAGDGAIGAVAVGPDVELGVYVLTVKTTASNGGTFSVRTPSGVFLPDLTVGTPYVSTHISLTIADGGVDWGAAAVVNVTVGPGNYTELAPAATNGSQIAAGVLYDNVNATDADTPCVVVVRMAEAKVDGLVWPSGISTDAQDAAIASLNARGILLR